MNARIFPTLAWAAYLKDWSGPREGERPAAYIIVLQDTATKPKEGCDHGIAVQSIMLGAAEAGLGGCIIGSVQRDDLKKVLHLEDRYRILLVVALGRPAERVVLEEVAQDGNIEYWRDKDDVHHVPKRTLQELLLARYLND